ncbi:MAG TPA: amidase [bacterium]|nr:amidase [bacterium]
MASDELSFASIGELAAAYRRREVSPVEATRAALARIERMDGRLNAYILVTADLALQRARAAETRFVRRESAHLLCGIPFSLKDIFDVEGLPMTCASGVLKDRYVSTTTATVAQRLLDTGAVLLGKNNMLEFAYGETHPEFGPTRNPWNLDRSTAGSSTGSAASVSAGQAYFSIGTDTGGSIRLPASYCGVVGLKPTYGLVSRRGVAALSWTADHVGPLTRTAADAGIVLGTIAGHDPGDPTSVARSPDDYAQIMLRPVRGLRVGVVHREFDGVHPDVQRAALEAVETLKSLRMEVRDVEVPPLEQAVVALLTVLSVEAASYHRQWLAQHPEGYSQAVRDRLKMGALIPAVDYLQAMRYRRVFGDRLIRVFESVDVLVLPASPGPAHPFSEETPGRDFTPYVRRTGPFNLTGLPALSVPCGFSTDALPIGLEIVGRPFADGMVLQVAHAYQQVTEWHQRRPAIAA